MKNNDHSSSIPDEDSTCIQAIIAGDKKMISLFFTQRCPPILNNILHKHAGNYPISLDDFCSELYLFLAINNWEKMRQFQFRCKLTTWIWIVARNLLNALIKKNQQQTYIDYQSLFHNDFVQTSIPDTCQMQTMIDVVSNHYYRVLLDLKMVEQHSNKDIATILGRSQGAVRQGLSRAKKELKKIYYATRVEE